MYSNYFQFSSIFELVFIQLGGQSRCRSTNQPTAMRHFGHMVSFPAAAYFGLDLGKAVAWPCELSFSTCCCYDLSSLPPRNKKMRCKTTVRARARFTVVARTESIANARAQCASLRARLPLQFPSFGFCAQLHMMSPLAKMDEKKGCLIYLAFFGVFLNFSIQYLAKT